MSAELDIYDLEGALEEALATVLRTYDFVVSTPNNSDFQKARPRIEVTALESGGAGRPLKETGAAHPAIGQLRETGWGMQVKLELITGVDITTHRALRAKLRNKMAKICIPLNAAMLNHHIHSCKNGGSQPIYKAQDGFYQSVHIYNLEIEATEDAFTTLAAEEA